MILSSIIVAGGLLFDFEEGKSEEARLFSYPISVAEKTYIVTVRTNWTSAPEVYLPEIASNYVSVEHGNFELFFKYNGQDIESYDLFLSFEPQVSPPA